MKMPTEKQIDEAPLILKEKEHKHLFSDKQIDEAKEPKVKIQKLKGFWNWITGGFNTPKLPDLTKDWK